ncbi:hypothetical protein KIN20_011362 [Parelaphostrongylus tenuis]|uniref:Uncharacterized protein n=1 Tax=Parelaphostrongylus tenuis TaxID=148309 RepID=A0AAD5QM02_PARTN|nr:hypothetical protein KIN20_011362 [Parelaphostrongylus tenuis]
MATASSFLEKSFFSEKVSEAYYHPTMGFNVHLHTPNQRITPLLSISSMAGSEVISEMINKMKEIGDRLNQLLKQREAEFSTTNVPLAAFDTSDMQLLLDETERLTSTESSWTCLTGKGYNRQHGNGSTLLPRPPPPPPPPLRLATRSSAWQSLSCLTLSLGTRLSVR